MPPLCLNCDQGISRNQALCPSCWKAIHFITSPFCEQCGLPFEVPVEKGTLCTECLTDPPPFTAARSVYLYDEASKGMILKFKHGDQLHPSMAMGEWMRRVIQDFLPTVDLILPVPLHRWRLWRRRYNQAALLAKAMSRHTGKDVALDALRRIKPTASQGHQNRAERERNVKGAFGVDKNWHQQIKGKNLLLVDDVMTSGATIRACCTVLQKAGASTIYVATLARVMGLRR